jgi:hypothetical protein
MSAGSEILLQIEGLDLDVVPKGEVLEKKFTFTVLPRNDLRCGASCQGGELPADCPLTGEIIKNSMGGNHKNCCRKNRWSIKKCILYPDRYHRHLGKVW